MLDYHWNQYKYKVIFGYFNMNPVKSEMNIFLNKDSLTNLIKENNCFKWVGSCIDLILTNSRYSFQYSSSIGTGLSDHCPLIFSIMKTKLSIEKSKRSLYPKLKLSLMVPFKKSYHQSLMLTTRIACFLTLLMFLISIT